MRRYSIVKALANGLLLCLLLLPVVIGHSAEKPIEYGVRHFKNAELYRAFEQMDRTRPETVIAFSEALDAHNDTAGHSRRVMEYSISIAQRMNLSEGDVEQLTISALLHDIGKIGVPDEILLKQSELSNEEYAIVKEHSEIGANILESMEPFKDLAPIVRHHHERFDGKGYPQGLQAEQIPLHARIITIADSFDAMTSNRPYRKALPLKMALSELERNKGTQFDPYITDIFLEIIDTQADIRRNFPQNTSLQFIL